MIAGFYGAAAMAFDLDNDPSMNGGFNGLIGFRIAEWEAGAATLEFDLAPRHLNRSGVLHGGVLATMIDAACGYAGCHCTVPGNVRLAVTLSLTTSFLAAAAPGTVRCVARKRGGGRRVFAATAEVYDSRDTLVAIGECMYQYRKGSEDPAGVPPPPRDGA